jgi:hypothetical protein
MKKQLVRLRPFWPFSSEASRLGRGECGEPVHLSEYMPDGGARGLSPKKTGIKVKNKHQRQQRTLYAKSRCSAARATTSSCPRPNTSAARPARGFWRTSTRAGCPTGQSRPRPSATCPMTRMAPTACLHLGHHGHAVNTAMVPEGQVNRYADRGTPALAGKLLLPDDMRTSFGMALKVLGYSPTTRPGPHRAGLSSGQVPVTGGQGLRFRFSQAGALKRRGGRGRAVERRGLRDQLRKR